MLRSVGGTMATGLALVLTTLVPATQVRAIDIVWDGGDALWDVGEWNGGQFISDILGYNDGADGYDGPNEEVQNIVIGSGATVTYDADFLGSDFEMRQGSTLTITDGATWQQLTDEFWSENRWTEMDLDRLTIDNGTFSRVGSVPGEGGGALIFGSWQGDDTFDEPEFPLDHQEILIEILNGGLLENEGQLWIGSWGDTPPNGTVINMVINDGALDLTGGDVPIGDPADGDLVFSNRFLDEVDQPTYSINFTGPGSITVDSAGIINATIVDPDNEIWDGLDPITYEQLWEAGILQANGQSGPDGASFGDFFSVEGMLGQDDYRLISNVTPGGDGVAGDYDGDDFVGQGDIDLVLLNWGADVSGGAPDGWTSNLPTGSVDQDELDAVLLNWGAMGGNLQAGGVPEPATWCLLLLGGLAAWILRR